jgi:heterodisulfide reductase subunit C
MRRTERATMEYESVFELAGYPPETFAVCLGCKICASVCTVNDVAINTNPQELLTRIFLGQQVGGDDSLLCNCTSCYRCTSACPWRIRIPEIIRALREIIFTVSPFDSAFKRSVKIWGRVYEPYVFLKSMTFLLKQGYGKHMTKWAGYVSFRPPRKVKRALQSRRS